MPTATVNDIEITYELEGDGAETIVLVNGLADTLETWAFQMEALLDAGYRVLRFDNRGVGRSSKPAGPYTTAMFADDTKALVDSLGIADFHLLGVSMGGMIGQDTRSPILAICDRSSSPVRTPPQGRSARGCSRSGPIWHPRWEWRPSCET